MIFSLIKSVDFVQDVVSQYLILSGVYHPDEMQKDMHDGANVYSYPMQTYQMNDNNKGLVQNCYEDHKFRLNPSSEEAVRPKVSRLQSADHEFNQLISRVYK